MVDFKKMYGQGVKAFLSGQALRDTLSGHAVAEYEGLVYIGVKRNHFGRETGLGIMKTWIDKNTGERAWGMADGNSIDYKKARDWNYF